MCLQIQPRLAYHGAARSSERALEGRARSPPRTRSARQKARTGGRRIIGSRHAWLGAAGWLDALELTSTSTFRAPKSQDRRLLDRCSARLTRCNRLLDNTLSWTRSALSAPARGFGLAGNGKGRAPKQRVVTRRHVRPASNASQPSNASERAVDCSV